MNILILSFDVTPYEDEKHLTVVYLKDKIKHKISIVL